MKKMKKSKGLCWAMLITSVSWSYRASRVRWTMQQLLEELPSLAPRKRADEGRVLSSV
ncbi:GLOD4 isoform 9, partial [Pongo abelii]